VINTQAPNQQRWTTPNATPAPLGTHQGEPLPAAGRGPSFLVVLTAVDTGRDTSRSAGPLLEKQGGRCLLSLRTEIDECVIEEWIRTRSSKQ
jgi:hypothetical protein